MAGLFDLFGPPEPSGGLLDTESYQPALTRDDAIHLMLAGMGAGILNANQPGASFGQAVLGGALNGAGNTFNQLLQLQAYQQKLRDAAEERAFKNDQRQAARSQMSAQATLQGGYDPLTKITWNGPRATTSYTPPNERMALMARAYPSQFAQQALEAEFPTPTETEKLATRLAKLAPDDPTRPYLEARLGVLGSEGGFRFGPNGATPVPGGPADPNYIAQKYAAIYENRPARTTQFERSIAGLPPEEQDALRRQYAERYARGRSTSAPVMRTIYGPDGQPQKVEWDDEAGEWRNIGGSKAPSARAAGVPTPAQERVNAEIARARSQVGQMTREEIDRKTSPYDRLGMPNPDYDRFLAATIRRALTRKTGDDPEYEAFANRFHGISLPDEDQSSGSSDGGVGAVEYKPGMTPKHGQIYVLPNGSNARWDDMKKKFVATD